MAREEPRRFPVERAAVPKLLRAELLREELPPLLDRRAEAPEARADPSPVRRAAPPTLEREGVPPAFGRRRSERARRVTPPLAAALSCLDEGPKVRRGRLAPEAPPCRVGRDVRRAAGALRAPADGVWAREEREE